MPGEMHREILRLVPLRDATAARAVSREMRDEVDEVWRAWGIRATAEDRREDICIHLRSRMQEGTLDYGPLVVYAHDGSHAHHLASLGLWWLALLAEAPGIHGMSWTVRDVRDVDQSPLMVAVQARRPVGRGADGRVECAYALGDKEVARVVRAAVGLGADVNRRLQGAWPLMTYCAKRGCLEAVKACLAAGAEVDAEGDDKDWGWWTALVNAAHGGHEAVVEALLEAGASATVGWEDEDWTLAAVCDGHQTPSIVRRLAEAGANANAPRLSGVTAIHGAAMKGNVAVMQALLDSGADVTVMNIDGDTAMHLAATGEVVRWLAARGVSVQGDGVNTFPLMSACIRGRVEAARALIELGADVHYRDRKAAQMALHCAVELRRAQEALGMTRLLLAAGADPDAVDGKRQTPLHVVRHAPCVDLLVDAGAELEAQDSRGRTPLRAAVTQSPCRVEVVMRLADCRVEVGVERALRSGRQPG